MDKHTIDTETCIAKLAPDEPVFVLRAQDLTAPNVVTNWIGTNLLTLPEKKRQDAEDCVRAMIAWQKAHPERAKRPD